MAECLSLSGDAVALRIRRIRLGVGVLTPQAEPDPLALGLLGPPPLVRECLYQEQTAAALRQRIRTGRERPTQRRVDGSIGDRDRGATAVHLDHELAGRLAVPERVRH